MFEEECVFQMTAAQRAAYALKVSQRLVDAGEDLHPIQTSRRGKIARSFWGHQWCLFVESFQDMDHRLVNGRSVIRSGSVIDLRIVGAEIKARVVDGELFDVFVSFAPLASDKWAGIVNDCADDISSLVDLLSGNFSQEIMKRFVDPESGLFPAPSEARFECNCLDYADMCKHVAAVLYGVGVRFDDQPDLFFGLRGVDYQKLVDTASDDLGRDLDVAGVNRRGSEIDLEGLFGIEFVE